MYHFPISTQLLLSQLLPGITIHIHSFILNITPSTPKHEKNAGQNDIFCIASTTDSRAIPLRMQIARLIEEGTLPQDLGWCQPVGWKYGNIINPSVNHPFPSFPIFHDWGYTPFSDKPMLHHRSWFFSANLKKSRSLDVLMFFWLTEQWFVFGMSCFTDDPQSNVAGLECEQSKLKLETPQCRKDDQCRTSVTMFTEDGDQLDVDMSSSCLSIPGSKFFWPMGGIENSRSSADHDSSVDKNLRPTTSHGHRFRWLVSVWNDHRTKVFSGTVACDDRMCTVACWKPERWVALQHWAYALLLANI